ncbi:MAG: adenosylmethionine--8-amino-7-oxononanoate transaminase [Myxococcales bacterium]|nr:adenosylmethionine--8-amino-7-oxononanoate transaminase [Myxococcales bacterium]
MWHPATHFRDLERAPPIAVERAQGSWLFDHKGRPVLDAISSWWTCLHGHGHEAIVAAVVGQVTRLDHVMFAGFTHEPAVALAEALVAAAPPGYGKVFFADCGAASVEIALKLSFQHRRQTGAPRRRRFATLANSYHGETLGALSVCGSDAYRETFAPLLMDVLELPAPALSHHEHADLTTDAGADTPEADAAVELLERHAGELTALVVEPLVQCAGRMAMPGAGYLRRVAGAAQALGVHLIADEIAVAFGRTGRLFACPWAGVTPDLLCLSKGLSGGVLPLACVLIREGFEDAFKGAPSRSFLHSHTFTANPIACAAGRASLELLTAPGYFERLESRVAAMASLRHAVARACPAVTSHRQAGMIAAMEVASAPDNPRIADGRLGLALREAALERGVLLRPLHDTIYWMPPLTISDDELATLARVTQESIEAVLG